MCCSCLSFVFQIDKESSTGTLRAKLKRNKTSGHDALATRQPSTRVRVVRRKSKETVGKRQPLYQSIHTMFSTIKI